jgi:type I restriction enzyme R subunit
LSYTENHLIEQPAIQLMEHELGWDGRTSNIELPTSKAEVKKPVKTEISPQRCFYAAVEELTRDFFLSALRGTEANREIDKLLRGGVKVKIPDRERGGQRTEVVP